MPPTPVKKKSRLEGITLEVHKTLANPSVTHAWGAFALKNHPESIRRVVWVRAQSPIETPRQAGGRLQGVPDGATTERGGARVRLCRIRVQTVDAHIHGEDEGAVDALLDDLLAAIEQTIPQVDYVLEDWPLENEAAASITRYPKAIIRLRIRLAVADEAKRLQSVLGEAHGCGILKDDGSLDPS